jgi:hypothetical protein
MHNAPPVAYPVGRFVWGRVLFVLVFLLSAAGLTSWQWLSQAASTMVWSAWVFWAVCASATAYGGPKQTLSEGHLLWSGEAWLWQSVLGADALSQDDQGLNLAVGMDFGGGMLLLLQAGDEPRQGHGPWFCAWVSERAMPSKWHGFRCAVYSRPKAMTESQEAQP